MSDANSGDESSKRPGMNVERAGAEGHRSSDNPPKKRSRRRWKKRPKRPDDGIRAENSRSPAPRAGDRLAASAAQASPEHSNASNNSKPSESPTGEDHTIGSPKNSKRRRRRRGRSSRNKNINTQPQMEIDSGENSTASDKSANSGSAQNSLHNKRNRRTDRRRNRRRVPSDKSEDLFNGAVDTAAVEATAAAATSAVVAVVAGVTTANNQNADAAGPANNRQSRRGGGKSGDRRQNRHWGDAYAALDLGTNNCRLLVAVPQQPGRFKVVDAFSRIVRLGEGLAATGQLREEAMERAIGALKMCAGKLSNRRVKGVRLIATEACRRASNGEEFLQRVEKQTGIKLEIIDRETEARLAVAGCSSLVDRKAKGVVLFDIGGGSSELALLDLDKRKRHDLSPAMVSWTSLPLGVVTLSEKHGGGRVVTRPIFENMVNDVSELLHKFEGRDALQAVSERGEVHLLGTSGTVTTLAGIHLNLPRYDRRRVDGIWMNSDDVDAMINRLVDMSFDQRAANPCIGYDRADLVLAGCAILVAIQRLWPCPRLRVADRGLREGLLTEMMNADNAWQRRPRYYRQNRN